MEAFLLSALGGIIIFIGFVLLIAIPSVIITVGYKKGVYLLAGLNVIIACAVALAGGILAGLCTLLVLLPFTYVIMYCITQKIGFARTIAASMFALMASLVVVYFIIEKNTQTPMIEILRQYIDNIAPELKEYMAQLSLEAELNEIADMALEYLLISIPTLMVSSSLIVSIATYSFTVSYLNNKENACIPYVKFELWDYPQQLGCSILIAFLIVSVFWNFDFAWAESLVVLIVSLYVLLLAIQGVSCAYFFEKHHKIPTIPAFAIISVALAVFPMLFVILGFTDKFFRLRFSYMVRHGMIKVKKIRTDSIFQDGFGINNNASNQDEQDEESDESDEEDAEDSENSEESDNDENNDDKDNNDENNKEQ